MIVRPRFIWGAGDTNLLPKIASAVKRGQFAWIGGGRHLTSTCHVDNVVEGILLAAERGAPGEIYFLTDGEPVEFRAFMTEVLKAYGVEPGSRSVPLWLARTLAAMTGWMKHPPVTGTAVALIGQEVTVVDAKARRELGYTSPGRVACAGRSRFASSPWTAFRRTSSAPPSIAHRSSVAQQGGAAADPCESVRERATRSIRRYGPRLQRDPLIHHEIEVALAKLDGKR